MQRLPTSVTVGDSVAGPPHLLLHERRRASDATLLQGAQDGATLSTAL